MGCPKRLRGDLGTENCHMENMQSFMRYNHGDQFAQPFYLWVEQSQSKN